MANNCYNFIQIEGSKKERKAFLKLLKKDESKGQNSGYDIYQNLKEKIQYIGKKIFS